MEKLPTGVTGIDKVLGGGIPAGYNIVLLGDPGTKKSLLAKHIAYEHLKNGGTVLYTVTDKSPVNLESEFKECGFEGIGGYFQDGSIEVIDVYSWKTGKDSVKTGDLTAVSIEIGKRRAKLEQKRNVMEIFDTASEFLLYSDHTAVLKFFEKACARARESGTLLIFIVEDGMHTKEELTIFESFSQGTLELQNDDKGRYIRVVKMDAVDYDLDWVPIDLIGNKIKVVKKTAAKKKPVKK
jgi:KaiC/GvpD/RAD55 family RecA-like ATPase